MSSAHTMYVFGGVASTIPDVPISAVLLALFLIGAVLHMRAFLKYNKRFKWSAALFGLCMSRLVAYSLRIASAEHPENRGVRIAALVFQNAATLLLYIVTLQLVKKVIFAMCRVTRKQKLILKIILAYSNFLFIPIIICLIVAAILLQLTSNPQVRERCTKILKFALVYQLVYASISMPLSLLMFFISLKKTDRDVQVKDNKRTPSIKELRINLIPIFIASALLTLEALIRTLQTFHNPTRNSWLYRKATYFAFQGLIEIMVVYLYLVLRIPHRYGRLEWGLPSGGTYEAETKSEV